MTKITCKANGPYLIDGEVELMDPSGARVDTAGKPRFALCRCGASSAKPFCDGTHGKIGFQAAEPAVKAAGK
jgi:CDGSH-type Zn-finger protein